MRPGDYRQAEALLLTALAEPQRTAPADPKVPEILNDLGATCHLLARYDEAEALYQESLSGWRRMAAPPAEQIARTLTNLATTERALGRYADAEAAYLEALRSHETSTTLSNLADLYRTQGKLQQALPVAERAVRIAGEARLVFSLQTLALIHRAAGDLDEAGALYRQALAKSIAQNGANHPATAAVENNLADIAVKLGHYAEAEQMARKATASLEHSLGPAHPRVAVAATNLAQALRMQEKYAEAERQYERALEILEEAGPAAAADRARCLANLADLNYHQGKPARAVELYRKAVEAMPDRAEAAMLMARLAEVRRSQGLYAESVKLYRRAIPMLESARSSDDTDLRVLEVPDVDRDVILSAVGTQRLPGAADNLSAEREDIRYEPRFLDIQRELRDALLSP